MTTYHGKNGVVKIGANTVAEVTGFSLTTAIALAGDNVQGDDWDTHLNGRKSWNGTIDARYFPGDTNGQAALEEGDSVSLELQPIGGTSGLQNFTGTATVAGLTVTSENEDVVTVQFQFTGNGALTRGTIGS